MLQKTVQLFLQYIFVLKIWRMKLDWSLTILLFLKIMSINDINCWIIQDEKSTRHRWNIFADSPFKFSRFYRVLLNGRKKKYFFCLYSCKNVTYLCACCCRSTVRTGWRSRTRIRKLSSSWPRNRRIPEGWTVVAAEVTPAVPDSSVRNPHSCTLAFLTENNKNTKYLTLFVSIQNSWRRLLFTLLLLSLQ